ncbi:ABC transporter substrate-binding protein [Lentimicrobium sp. S6]|uniref:ABC transporter substrate-binding protein n=1 Tax=Lentimicrobium sp. S6 TaxID=2735872 RepID=UPI0015553C14|nr:ABC transporter substrate-binding protein [Lentimicrobium sp. S6]NPD47015.1 ABC transporter substrate-binding protein [Lentimicrobium sp. S6]
MKANTKIWFLTLLLLVSNLGAFSAPIQTLDSIQLKLKWKHQFQFAGYYAAIEKGYYKNNGLFVEIIEAEHDDEPISSVLNGEAQYGIASSDIILARNSGFPVVLLANIFQHSPHIFLSLKKDGNDNIHDLAGKTIMLENQTAELLAYLAMEQIPLDDLSFINHTFSPQSLINQEADAMSAYSTDEPFLLIESGVEYNIFNPRASGIDFYGDNLFTTDDEIQNHPQRVKAFLEASLKGWDYALKNQDALINIILEHYSTRHSKAHLEYEAQQTNRLIMPNVIEIGYINKDRWRRIGEIYSELGMLPREFSMEGLIYERNPQPSNKKAYIIFGIIISFTIIISFIAIRFYSLSKKLKDESENRKQKEKLISGLEERYRNLAENAPFPIIISSSEDNKILYLNPRACEKFEITSHLALKKPSSMLYVEPEKRNQLISQLNKHGFVKNTEFKLKTAGGKEFWSLISSNFISFDGHPALFSAIMDITDSKELEDKLIIANQDKDQLFSIIAHDLRGPLGTLDSLLELLVNEDENIPQEEQQEILLRLKETSKNTFELLENLLMWSLSQKNDISFHPKENSISEIIQSNLLLFTEVSHQIRLPYQAELE